MTNPPKLTKPEEPPHPKIKKKQSAKNLIPKEDSIKKICAYKTVSTTSNNHPTLKKGSDSLTNLTIKQKTENLIQLGKKLNEQKTTESNYIPKKMSLGELTEEQKLKFEVRIRKAKKKKMFTSRIKAKGEKISSKIEELAHKYENNLIMQSMIEDVVSKVEMPLMSIMDEDIESLDELQSALSMKKVSSEQVLKMIQK